MPADDCAIDEERKVPSWVRIARPLAPDWLTTELLSPPFWATDALLPSPDWSTLDVLVKRPVTGWPVCMTVAVARVDWSTVERLSP